MPIVHRPEMPEAKKKCIEKPPYFHDGSYQYSSSLRMYQSIEPKGTLWECPGCGKYSISTVRNGVRVWRPVTWYHFGAKRIIRELERPGVDNGSTVL